MVVTPDKRRGENAHAHLYHFFKCRINLAVKLKTISSLYVLVSNDERYRERERVICIETECYLLQGKVSLLLLLLVIILSCLDILRLAPRSHQQTIPHQKISLRSRLRRKLGTDQVLLMKVEILSLRSAVMHNKHPAGGKVNPSTLARKSKIVSRDMKDTTNIVSLIHESYGIRGWMDY